MASLINNVLPLSHSWESRRPASLQPSISVPAWRQKLILLWGLLPVFNQILSLFDIFYATNPLPRTAGASAGGSEVPGEVKDCCYQSLCQSRSSSERRRRLRSASRLITCVRDIHNVGKKPGLDPVLISGTHFSVTTRLRRPALFSLRANGFS